MAQGLGVLTKVICIVSLVLGLIVLICSGLYFHDFMKKTNWGDYSVKDVCEALAVLKPELFPSAKECVQFFILWEVTAIFGIVVGVVQTIFGIAALTCTARGTGISTGIISAHVVFFLLSLVTLILMYAFVFKHDAFVSQMDTDRRWAASASLTVDCVFSIVAVVCIAVIRCLF